MSLVYENVVNDEQSDILIEIKAHAAKLINNFDIQNIDDFILLSQKVFKCLVIINP